MKKYSLFMFLILFSLSVYPVQERTERKEKKRKPVKSLLWQEIIRPMKPAA